MASFSLDASGEGSKDVLLALWVAVADGVFWFEAADSGRSGWTWIGCGSIDKVLGKSVMLM